MSEKWSYEDWIAERIASALAEVKSWLDAEEEEMRKAFDNEGDLENWKVYRAIEPRCWDCWLQGDLHEEDCAIMLLQERGQKC